MDESRAFVCGLYRNEATLKYAICHLRNVGFLDRNFSVIFPATDPNVTVRTSGLPGGRDDAGLLRTIWTQEILLSVQCESSGQAVIARKILQCTDADTVVSPRDGNIEFPTDQCSYLA